MSLYPCCLRYLFDLTNLQYASEAVAMLWKDFGDAFRVAPVIQVRHFWGQASQMFADTSILLPFCLRYADDTTCPKTVQDLTCPFDGTICMRSYAHTYSRVGGSGVSHSIKSIQQTTNMKRTVDKTAAKIIKPRISA